MPPKEEPVKEEIKPKPQIKEEKPKKKKIIKKVIYQEASSSDSDDADEVEIVKVKNQQKLSSIFEFGGVADCSLTA